MKHTLARTKDNGLVLQSPKTRQSMREVYLPPFVTESLREHRKYQDEEREGRSVVGQEELCVHDEDRGPPGWLQRFGLLRCHVEELGLRRVRLHDLRHAAASLALQAGSDMKVVSEQLGHSAIGITLNLYSHVSEQARQRVASNLQALVKAG